MAHGHNDAHAGHFVPPTKVYFGVFGALLVLTVATVAVARVDLGAANTVVAMVVATIKASLVSLFFMQLRWDSKINSIVFIFGLIFLSLFFIFTLLDITSRGYVESTVDNHTVQRDAEAQLRLEAEAKGLFPKPGAAVPGDVEPADERVNPLPPPVPAAPAPAEVPLPEGAAPASLAPPATASDAAAPASAGAVAPSPPSP